jgi:hypothetical protein
VEASPVEENSSVKAEEGRGEVKENGDVIEQAIVKVEEGRGEVKKNEDVKEQATNIPRESAEPTPKYKLNWLLILFNVLCRHILPACVVMVCFRFFFCLFYFNFFFLINCIGFAYYFWLDV